MGINIFYSMVKEYAEKLLDSGVNGIHSPDAELSAILTSSHDIIAGVTGITVCNGTIDSIPAEYMAVVTMANSGQTRARQMLTMKLSDFSVCVPDESQLMLLLDMEEKNSNCQIFISKSESVPLSKLLDKINSGTANYVRESSAPAVETVPEPVPVREIIPEPVPVREIIPEPVPVREIIPEPVPAEEIIPESVPAEEITPESEDVSKLSFEQIANELFESEKYSVPESVPEQAPDTPIESDGTDFFSGFDDDFSGNTNINAFNGVEFLTNSAPDPERIRNIGNIQSEPTVNNEEPEYSSRVDIDESNPFYEEKTSENSDKIAYFAEIPDDSKPDKPKTTVNIRPHTNAPGQEMLSKEELLKQAKQRKKIAKANFSFRKK